MLIDSHFEQIVTFSIEQIINLDEENVKKRTGSSGKDHQQGKADQILQDTYSRLPWHTSRDDDYIGTSKSLCETIVGP
jgi:hypothetical protein